MYVTRHLSSLPSLGLLAAWLLTISVTGYLSMHLGYTQVYAENGFMENLQVVLLCLAFPGFIHAALTTEHTKTLPSFMALLVFAFVFRELDIEKFNSPDWAIFLFAGDGRALYLLPLIGLLVKLMLNARRFIQYARYYFDTRSIIYIGMAALFYGVFSEPFDKKYVPIAHSDFWEESLEIAATMLLFAASFRLLTADLNQIARQIAAAQSSNVAADSSTEEST
jgi:hypothetical protein